MNSAISDIIFNYDSGAGNGSAETLEEVRGILNELGYEFTIEEIQEEFNSRL